ncbi:MAG: prepilin-type N-terminal cleavage/methylation domain-containing protein [Chthonomonas sp.]|nr:prepilin-type N-terminal cleavage/methylation domain-containing protein [Chthonomonas sp.]
MTRRPRVSGAFTLIELLTVMAITGILLTIITLPVVQSFNFTRAGQGFADAQDRARILIDQVTREVSNAAGVRDNSGDLGSIDVVVPGLNTQPELIRLAYSKIDILVPSAGEPLRGPSGALLNPNLLINPNGNPDDPANWREDPTLRTPVGQVTLPTAQGFRMVRYFIGLRDPFGVTPATGVRNEQIGARYNNPYDAILQRGAGQDNLYVLYRADVDYKTYNRALDRWEINASLFPDLNGDGVLDLDDPSFFRQYGATETKPGGGAYSAAERTAKADLIKRWRARSRVVTELSRYDMIQPIYDKATFRALYDGNVPRILSLVQFRPGRVASEPVEGGVVVRSGLEFDNAVKMGPDVMRTKFGAWANSVIRMWPSQYNGAAPWTNFGTWQPGTPYLIGRERIVSGQAVGYSLYDFPGTGAELTAGTETFDMSAYGAAAGRDRNIVPATAAVNFPFTYAVNQANGRSGWLGDAAMRSRFVPFVVDPSSGQVKASFGIEEVGTTVVAGVTDNRPVTTGGAELIPSQAGPSAPGDWTQVVNLPSSPTSQINSRFNVLWNNWTALCPNLDKSDFCKRFVDLRFLPCADGTVSPLHPTQGFARARIVPGSEVVIGPNQIPGPSYGAPIRYTRVGADTSGNVNVGPNQYFINYVDRRDLTQAAYAELGYPGILSDPTTYDPTNFAYAVLQPRFKAGYLEFNSDPQSPIPAGPPTGRAWNISVSYRFQFTESTDVFAVDYDTRQLMDVNLTIRNYSQSNLPNAQSVSLRGSATVRNFTR